MFRSDGAVVQVLAASIFLSFDGRGTPAVSAAEGTPRLFRDGCTEKTRRDPSPFSIPLWYMIGSLIVEELSF
jgi:hypothetical protein